MAVEIEVVSASTDVHSGLAGGAVQNPARALAQLLATMWHPGNNSVAVPGFYDSVRPITDADRWGRVCVSERLGWGGARLSSVAPAAASHRALCSQVCVRVCLCALAGTTSWP